MSSPDRAQADWPMLKWAAPWTQDEIERARYLAQTQTVYSIARLLGRTPDAVWTKLHKLGVSTHADRWQNRRRRNGR